MYVYIYSKKQTNPAMYRMWHKVIFKAEYCRLNTEFSFSIIGYLTKLNNSAYTTIYLELNTKKTDGFVPFPKVLALSGT